MDISGREGSTAKSALNGWGGFCGSGSQGFMNFRAGLVQTYLGMTPVLSIFNRALSLKD
jgi:hypothetical protein